MVLRTPLFPIMGSLVPCCRNLVRLTLQGGDSSPVSALQARYPGGRRGPCSFSLPLGEGGTAQPWRMRGTPPEKLQTNSEGKSKTNPNYLTGNCLRINLLNFDTLPLIRRCAPPRSVKKTCQWHVFSVGHSGYAARRPQSGSPLLLTIFRFLPQGKAFRRNSHRHPTNGARLKRGSSPYRTRPRSVGGNRTKIVRGD